MNSRGLRDLLRFEELVNGRARTGPSFLTSYPLIFPQQQAGLISLCYWNNLLAFDLYDEHPPANSNTNFLVIIQFIFSQI